MAERLPDRKSWTIHGYGFAYRDGTFYSIGRNDELTPIDPGTVIVWDLEPDGKTDGLKPQWYAVNPTKLEAERAEAERRQRTHDLETSRGELSEIERQLKNGPDLPLNRNTRGVVALSDPAASYAAVGNLNEWKRLALSELEGRAAEVRARISRLEKESG